MKTVPNVLLRDFRRYIEDKLDNKGTADRYFYAVCRFFREYEIDDLSLVTPEKVLDALQTTRGQNNTSALKMGLKHLKSFYPWLETPEDNAAQEASAHKRDRRVHPEKVIYYEEVSAKVMSLTNRKLKLAYLLMMVSGLRVSETAALEKDDIRVTPEGITVHVRHGKGGSNGIVTCMRDPYLEMELPEYLAELPDGERPFYAAKTMKNEALDLGLECHDFRRIAAIRFRRQEMAKRRQDPQNAPSVELIDEKTMELLRHKQFATTKRYLYGRAFKVKSRKEEKCDNADD